jgi:hypothetical protein
MALPHDPATSAFQIQRLRISDIISKKSALQLFLPDPALRCKCT